MIHTPTSDLAARQVNLGATQLELSAEELMALDEVSTLPPEYPGWMLARQGEARTKPPVKVRVRVSLRRDMKISLIRRSDVAMNAKKNSSGQAREVEILNGINDESADSQLGQREILAIGASDRCWSRLCKNVGLIERPTSDDCVLRNGFGIPKFSVFSFHFVF